MSFEISRLSSKLRGLQQRRNNLTQKYNQEMAEIEAEIKNEQSALNRINALLEPYICKGCGGSGEESFIDAAGSRDHRKCRYCKGTGIETAE